MPALAIFRASRELLNDSGLKLQVTTIKVLIYLTFWIYRMDIKSRILIGCLDVEESQVFLGRAAVKYPVKRSW